MWSRGVRMESTRSMNLVQESHAKRYLNTDTTNVSNDSSDTVDTETSCPERKHKKPVRFKINAFRRVYNVIEPIVTEA